jgi:hypothetical protein
MKPRPARFNEWIDGLKNDHPELTEAMANAIHRNMYERDFIYCADREFAKNCKTPSLLLAGNDEAHPRPISDELAKLLPNVEYITEWKEGPALEAAKVKVKEFLAKHTPRNETSLATRPVRCGKRADPPFGERGADATAARLISPARLIDAPARIAAVGRGRERVATRT